MREAWELDVTEIGPIAGGLSVEQIRRRLMTDRVGGHIVLFGEVGSTNDALRRRAEQGAADGTVVLAESQATGRGRRGKPWFSPAGLNLYASVLCRPSIPLSAVPVYTFITSLAMTDAIGAERIPAAIKWPNDVLIDGRKAAAALVTCARTRAAPAYVILGAGVNLNVDRAWLETALGPAAAGATSLSEVAGRPIDRNGFAATFLNSLERWDDEYRAKGPAGVLAEWRARDALTGRAVEIRDGERSYCGTVRGVTDHGRLIVEEADGTHHEVSTGEVVVAR
ncbi:MAG: biotin--[acetyl-CoA-carboxylase] ligase [Candidatus Rokubacteria bacterium]|nr:biotin--[acetyl-CoA-carboxylase] ligase [Candidatus Rokubacteria bacterium]